MKPINAFASFLKNVIERSGIDGSVNGVGKLISYSSRQLRLIQSGQVGNYILFMVLAIVVVILLWVNDNHIYQIISKMF